MRINRLLGTGCASLLLVTVGTGTAQAAGTLDQSNSASYYSASSLASATDGNGQTFTAGISGQLTHLEVYVSQFGANASLNVSIYAVSGGLPTGSALASTTVAASAASLNGGLVDAEFTTPAQLVAGTQYAITLTSTLTAGFYNMGFSSPNTYSDGGALVINNSSRPNYTSPGANYDLIFITYVLRATTQEGPPSPPVLQQFELASSVSRDLVSCDSSAASSLNWGGAGSGGWGDSWAQWANGGKGGPVCSRTLSYSNQRGQWVVS